jgi:thymidylate kinase
VKTILVTLSGTHGTGKSTNAGRVYYLLNRTGRKFSYLRHQDLLDPFGFIVRRMARILHVDVNYLEATTPVRVLWSLYLLFIYYPLLAGGIALRRRAGYSTVSDRYLYDLIVGFWGANQRVPIEHLLVWVLPHPDVSFVFSADEQRILADRPEHTAEFIRNEKRLYNDLADQFHLTRISTSESKQAVWQRVISEIESRMNGNASSGQRSRELINN